MACFVILGVLSAIVYLIFKMARYAGGTLFSDSRAFNDNLPLLHNLILVFVEKLIYVDNTVFSFHWYCSDRLI